ncbi:MAG: hypothetical protein WB716_08380, partial [Candidatus Acidiferrales bacterium]
PGRSGSSGSSRFESVLCRRISLIFVGNAKGSFYLTLRPAANSCRLFLTCCGKQALESEPRQSPKTLYCPPI